MNKQYTLPRVGVGAVIIDNENRILLALRKREPEAGKWSIPGGKVEPYEKVEDALIREVKEEVSLEVKVKQLMCITETVAEENGLHWISPIYKVERVNGEAINMEPDACEEIRWFSLQDLPDNLACYTVPAIRVLKENL